jgi:hypothetical protein
LRRSILACGLLLAFAGLTTAAAAAVASGSTGTSLASTASTTTTETTSETIVSARTHGRAHAIAYWSRHIRREKAGTRRWRTVILGRPSFGNGSRALAVHSVTRLRQLARRWHHREHQAWWRANHPPSLNGWLCIHHYEGSWRDGGSPYWGGLQMNLSFQETYGSWLLRHKGTADHWSPLEQIWVAVRAARARGFSPWPNTARNCGMA